MISVISLIEEIVKFSFFEMALELLSAYLKKKLTPEPSILYLPILYITLAARKFVTLTIRSKSLISPESVIEWPTDFGLSSLKNSFLENLFFVRLCRKPMKAFPNIV